MIDTPRDHGCYRRGSIEVTMSSCDERLDKVLKMLEPLGDISYKQMMGEYILYLDGTQFGGINDDRFMLKVTPSVDGSLPDAPREPPYPGAKDMVVVDDVDAGLLLDLIPRMCSELPRKKACRLY